MKTCKAFEKQLVAYMHGELDGSDFHALDRHLETCGACRAELDARRATLELLGDALEAAPAPVELDAWRNIPHRPSAHRMTLADYWFSPQFRAGLVTAAACSLFIFLSFSLVMINVVQKDGVAFEAEPLDEHEVSVITAPAIPQGPKMELKKLKVPVNVTKESAKPKLRKRIVAKPKPVAMPNIQMPEVEGVSGGVGSDASDGSVLAGEQISFNMAEVDSFGVDGRGAVVAGRDIADSLSSIQAQQQFNTEQYDWIVDNSFKASMENPLSTFSIDVDRAAYANVRRFLSGNSLPPPDAVRIEEMVNYFEYDYPQPEGGDPFVVSMEVGECPWNNHHQLALIGLQGLKLETSELPPNNLVFLLDVSGSMNRANKLPLLKSAMRLMVKQLRPEDRVSIVVYAGAAGLVLEPTSDKAEIREAINRLSAGGSTAGGAGIGLAYKTAQEHFVKKGNNRVILATDGDFNVGTSSDGALVRLIEEKRDSGIFLTVLGFGTGNLKDSKMEKLADKGNGNYAYIDDILEAKKVLVNEMGGTLVTIAKDVKIQVEFNPREVKAYRLIGYENRVLAKEDFDNDKKDAGELGAGHTVTALYELVPAGAQEMVPIAGELKYQRTKLTKSKELMTVKLRYKPPDGDVSKLIEKSIQAADLRALEDDSNLEFASAVAEFGMLLRHSEYKGNANYESVLRRAREAKGRDAGGYRGEFIRLVEKAQLLDDTVQ